MFVGLQHSIFLSNWKKAIMFTHSPTPRPLHDPSSCLVYSFKTKLFFPPAFHCSDSCALPPSPSVSHHQHVESSIFPRSNLRVAFEFPHVRMSPRQRPYSSGMTILGLSLWTFFLNCQSYVRSLFIEFLSWNPAPGIKKPRRLVVHQGSCYRRPL